MQSQNPFLTLATNSLKPQIWDFPQGPVVKTSASNTGGADSIPTWWLMHKLVQKKKKNTNFPKICVKFKN